MLFTQGISAVKLEECDGADYTGGWFFPDHLAQFFQGRPADVAGVDDVAVKHNYLHFDPCCAHCKTGRQCLHGLLPGQAGEEKGAVAAFSGAV